MCVRKRHSLLERVGFGNVQTIESKDVVFKMYEQWFCDGGGISPASCTADAMNNFFERMVYSMQIVRDCVQRVVGNPLESSKSTFHADIVSNVLGYLTGNTVCLLACVAWLLHRDGCTRKMIESKLASAIAYHLLCKNIKDRHRQGEHLQNSQILLPTRSNNCAPLLSKLIRTEAPFHLRRNSRESFRAVLNCLISQSLESESKNKRITHRLYKRMLLSTYFQRHATVIRSRAPMHLDHIVPLATECAPPLSHGCNLNRVGNLQVLDAHMNWQKGAGGLHHRLESQDVDYLENQLNYPPQEEYDEIARLIKGDGASARAKMTLLSEDRFESMCARRERDYIETFAAAFGDGE